MIFQKISLVPVKYFPALAAGLCMSLAFPGVRWSFMAFFALIPLLVRLGKLTSADAFKAGLLAGFLHFLTLIYWIVPTVHVYGGLHPFLAIAALVLLCGYLALYPALFAFFFNRMALRLNTWYTPFFTAGLWIGLEYVRTHAFTGFGWGLLGYSQYQNLRLIQVADFSGVYGVSFLIVFVNSSLAGLWVSLREKKQKPIAAMACTFLLLAAALGYGHHKISLTEIETAAARKAVVSVIQGNIPQDVKWDKAFKDHTLDQYINLSKKELDHHPDLVIWPETALPFYYGFDRPLSGRVDAFVREAKTPLLFGTPAFSMEKAETKYYNRACMLNRFSIVTDIYDKTHLVPFGEYVPLGRYLTFLGKITAQAGNFSPGKGGFKPLEFKESSTGVLICFEILFPSASAAFTRNGADILTTITNDAWFGRTSAPEQHLAIAVLRAVENRRALARAANTGISGFIGPAGDIIDTTGLFVDAAVTRELPVLEQISFYTAHGDLFAISALVAICFVFMVKEATRMLVKKGEETSK